MKIDELKASLLVMFEQHAKKEKSFSAVLLNFNGNISRTTDEGFCNSTANSVVSESSHTHPKNVFQAQHETDSSQIPPENVVQAVNM